MALTKIQPSGLDQTLNYSVNQLSANTVLDGGVEILAVANSAYAQANAAFIQANAVYNYANTLSPTDTFARTQANAAFIQANAAFTAANTGASTASTKKIAGGYSLVFGG